MAGAARQALRLEVMSRRVICFLRVTTRGVVHSPSKRKESAMGQPPRGELVEVSSRSHHKRPRRKHSKGSSWVGIPHNRIVSPWQYDMRTHFLPTYPS